MPIAMRLLRELRQAGVSVTLHAGAADGMGGMKSQFKKADASGARFALVFGAQELEQGMVAIKPLRGVRDGEVGQQLQPLDNVSAWGASLRGA